MTVIRFEATSPQGHPWREGDVAATYFLTESETRRHGVPIRDALHVGLLTVDDFRRFMMNCRTCDVGQTRDGRHNRHAASDELPGQCANRSLIDGLKGLV
ncbi:MAG: DUF6455 family protein [Paracoccaceae bacterium]